jgi:hypothetical protein
MKCCLVAVSLEHIFIVRPATARLREACIYLVHLALNYAILPCHSIIPASLCPHHDYHSQTQLQRFASDTNLETLSKAVDDDGVVN